jgi:hypothetical protein
VPPGLQSYSTSVNTTNIDGTPLRVDVSASLNLQTGVVTWTFRSIDPATGLAPTDVFAGFLPPDNSTGRGQASVTYTVQPKANAAPGAPVNAQATVVFDVNPPLSTNTATNTIDNGPPTSSVNPLPAAETSSTFTVSWSGSDPNGPGIAGYDVYVSDNGGPFAPLLTGTTQTATLFSGQVGHSYSFYSVATDPLGFRQATPMAAQAGTTVSAPGGGGSAGGSGGGSTGTGTSTSSGSSSLTSSQRSREALDALFVAEGLPLAASVPSSAHQQFEQAFVQDLLLDVFLLNLVGGQGH